MHLMIKGLMVTHLHEMYYYKKHRFTIKTLLVIYPDGYLVVCKFKFSTLSPIIQLLVSDPEMTIFFKLLADHKKSYFCC